MTAINTNFANTVVFPTPFRSNPTISFTIWSGNPEHTFIGLQTRSATQFTARASRTSAPAELTWFWMAVAP